MENPIEMDDLGVSLFLETPIYRSCSWKKKYMYVPRPSKGGKLQPLGSVRGSARVTWDAQHIDDLNEAHVTMYEQGIKSWEKNRKK